MPIISVRDNENNRWKRNAKPKTNKQTQKRTRGTLIISFLVTKINLKNRMFITLNYSANLSHHIKNKLLKLYKEFCEETFNIRLVLIHSKIKIIFHIKTWLHKLFTYASCSSSYIGETCRHFKTRIEEHIKKDNKPHIFKHIHCTATCFDSYNFLCFKIIDKANSKFGLKI